MLRRRHEPRGQPHFFVLPPNLYNGTPGRGDFLVPASSALRSLHPKAGERSPTVARPCRAPRALHRRASDNAVRHPALCASVPPDPTAPGNASIRSNQLLPPAFGHLAAGRARVVAVSRADEYRRRAQQCLEMARTFGDRDARVTLAHMAEVCCGWRREMCPNKPCQHSSNNSRFSPRTTAKSRPLKVGGPSAPQ